jgi:hypothetical protein
MSPQAKQNVVDDRHEVRCQVDLGRSSAACACDPAMGDKIIRRFSNAASARPHHSVKLPK